MTTDKQMDNWVDALVKKDRWDIMMLIYKEGPLDYISIIQRLNLPATTSCWDLGLLVDKGLLNMSKTPELVPGRTFGLYSITPIGKELMTLLKDVKKKHAS